jgi:hypothetical protein
LLAFYMDLVEHAAFAAGDAQSGVGLDGETQALVRDHELAVLLYTEQGPTVAATPLSHNWIRSILGLIPTVNAGKARIGDIVISHIPPWTYGRKAKKAGIFRLDSLTHSLFATSLARAEQKKGLAGVP